MQTYQSTPDYYRDYIEHGWLKDQAAKVHKYIKRWRNEAGKWVYQYKNELQDAKTRRNRKKMKLMPEDVSFDINGKRYGAGPNGGVIAFRSDDGRRKSYDIQAKKEARARSTNQRKNAIYAGRRRAAAKGHNVKGYSGNLSSRGYANSQTDFNKMVKDGRSIKNTNSGGQSMRKALDERSSKRKNLSSRGYSGSRGSGENQRLRNLGTRRSSHNEYYWDVRRMNHILDRQDINGGFKPPSAKKSTITKNKAPKKFQERMAKKAANSNNKMRHDHYWGHPQITQHHIQPHRSRPSWTYKKRRTK